MAGAAKPPDRRNNKNHWQNHRDRTERLEHLKDTVTRAHRLAVGIGTRHVALALELCLHLLEQEQQDQWN